ncbi:unnamed protein product [Mesocestoides corti]|uniref:Uncharacterized protein n=1 Tax=Mesocestoides corti TaxID=53468 RepID=A0A0R3UI36_MESCO|nr:unnamed protein product [Mesocestoides corti]
MSVTSVTSLILTCSRSVLFHSEDVIHHLCPKKDGDSQSVKPCNQGELFTNALEWFNSQTSDVQGKLYCPKCAVKIGSYNWCGEPCVCGRWLTPAFHFSRKHLDELPGGAIPSAKDEEVEAQVDSSPENCEA